MFGLLLIFSAFKNVVMGEVKVPDTFMFVKVPTLESKLTSPVRLPRLRVANPSLSVVIPVILRVLEPGIPLMNLDI
jgi:hypothetical protein